MRSTMETTPVWREQRLAFPIPSLTADTATDVCVVGAGLAGLTTAYLLAREGRNVVVLDADGILGGDTMRTTAHLTGILDDRYYELAFSFGEKEAQLIAESHLAAINRIEAIIREEGIECDFTRCDGYLAAAKPQDSPNIEREAESLLKCGFADRTIYSKMPLDGVNMPNATVRIPQQAQFSPLKYATALAEAFLSRGGRIFTEARVVSVKEGMPVEVLTETGHKVHASAAVIATYTPINDWVTMHTKQAAYRSYAIACALPEGAYPPFLLWDTEEPYHYVRTLRDGEQDYLIVGGEDHKTGQENDADNRYAALEAWTRRHFPLAGPVARQWSGQIMEPVDRRAFIGRNPGDDNIFIATGFSGNGMTYATIAGILIRDLILGRHNHWADLYNPARKPVMAAKEYIRENANAVACMVGDWVSRGTAKEMSEIKPGEGAVLRDGLSKVAAYRDERGEMHVCSAVCTHLNCIVQWNAGEKTWDCPCHGSRFDIEGKVLNGPAIKALAPRGQDETGEAAPVTELPLGGPFPAGPIITGDRP